MPVITVVSRMQKLARVLTKQVIFQLDQALDLNLSLECLHGR